MPERAPDDHAGHRLDAADRVLAVAAKELASLEDTSMPALLYATIIGWADEQIDLGYLTEDEPEFDQIEKALATLAARVHVQRERSQS